MRLFIRSGLLAAAVALTAVVAGGVSSTAAPPAAEAPRPNVIVILVDDMGFSDLGCYGSEIPTPNIDALAASGLRFTQFYNSARCSPTRAALLTGLHPHQAGMGHNEEKILPASQGTYGRLHERCVTLAEVLGSSGYHTSIVGKWHVGQPNDTPPEARGFQRTAACVGQLSFPRERSPESAKWVYLDGRKVAADSPEVGEGDWYSTFMFTDWSLRFLDDARSKGRPFFQYIAHCAPHFPLKAPADAIARHRGKYLAGWDALRAERHRRQIAMRLVDARWPLSPRPPEVPAWDSLDPAEQDRFDHMMAVYAAMIDCIDQSVGRLVAGLKERGLYDNTLILLLSDNGGNAESGPQGIAEGEPLGGPDSRVTLGMGWATLNNTPFRGYKHFTHEGGIATPLIVHWPASIPAARCGGFERQPSHVIDILPTALEATGTAYPTEYNGRRILPAEGISLLPAFSGDTLHRLKPLCWMHEGNRAIRSGDWKAVSTFKGRWELYNLAADRTEQHDLFAERTDLAEMLVRQWNDWAATTFVDEWTGSVYDVAGNTVETNGPQQNGADPIRASSTAPVPATASSPAAAAGPISLAWHDAREFTVEGRGFADTEGRWDRLPARAKGVVPPDVWKLSKNTAGVCVRLVTDAREIHADWDGGDGMWHMPPAGVSGLDVYERAAAGGWSYVATGIPKKERTVRRIVGDRPGVETEYLIFLPLYADVTDLKLGFPVGAKVAAAPRRPAGEKPIVFYGTSVTQGGCASRAGMSHAAILARRLDREVINLGFSGSGRMEPALADCIAGIDASVYVLECLPNLTIEMVRDRIDPFVRRLRRDHSLTPILLVENLAMPTEAPQNEALREVRDRLLADGVTGLHYLPSVNCLHTGGEEGTVDGVHPTDLGFVRIAEAYEPLLRKLLGAASPLTASGRTGK
ncbi:MAG: sulfatase-like hydrolase/transferase [Planctomycetota bacterium]